MTVTKPIFVLIPGAWHTPECFDMLKEELTTRGYESLRITLTSVGAEPPNKSLSDDVAVARETLTRLTEEGRQIVVVSHSYGGLVGAGAVKDLEYKSQPTRNGKRGGVITLVYMTAFVASKGQSLLDMLGGKFQYFMLFDGNYCHSSDQETVFYNDLPPVEQKRWIAKLKHMSKPVFLEGSLHEPWHDLPCMYILCDKDQAVPIAAQEAMAKMLGEDTVTLRLGASHSPFLSMPEKVADGLELAVREGIKRSGVVTA